LPNSVLWSISYLCSATADFSGWPGCVCLICFLPLVSGVQLSAQHTLCHTHM
jgi:hypothetical protein